MSVFTISRLVESLSSLFFFFNLTCTTKIYTLSLHDALPILEEAGKVGDRLIVAVNSDASVSRLKGPSRPINALDRRSEEHTSELQTRPHLVCRLLLEKKKKSSCDRVSTAHEPLRVRPSCDAS